MIPTALSASARITGPDSAKTRKPAIWGHRSVTTVQGWKMRGVIPARQQRSVVAVAKSQGIELRLVDFVPDLAAESDAT